MSGQDLVAVRRARSGSGEDTISNQSEVSALPCMSHLPVIRSYLNIVEALEVQGRYRGDAAVDEINVLDNNGVSACITQRYQTAT